MPESWAVCAEDHADHAHSAQSELPTPHVASKASIAASKPAMRSDCESASLIHRNISSRPHPATVKSGMVGFVRLNSVQFVVVVRYTVLNVDVLRD